MKENLKSMNIIVTGASRGIGYELVKLFSTDPNNTVIAIARNETKLIQLKEECLIKNPSSKVIPILSDLSNKVAVENLIAALTKKVQTVNILINNAGAITKKPFVNIDLHDLEYIFNVNVFSAFLLIKGLLPIMDRAKGAHVVNIGSMGGFQGSSKFAGLSAYSSSKAALACLTECLAEEFKGENIAFNCLALGATQTEMLNEAFPGYTAPISAEKMAAFIADFSINGNKYMNGKTIPISLGTP